jgi:hypothetical protein
MRSFRLIIIIFSFCIVSVGLYSQPVPQWIERFNGLLDSTDVPKDMVVDNLGNTYVTGESFFLLGLFQDALTISYDPDGNLRWTQSFGTLLFHDGAAAITLDNTQQYVYVTGYTNALLNLTAGDYFIAKYEAATGDVVWSRTYNNGILGDDKATSIVMDSQNNPIISGYSQGFLLLLTPYDYATIKYNDAGTQQWVARYNGPANQQDRGYAITVDAADNIIVTGESIGSGSDYDYATVKYNPAGVQQWAARYNGTGNSADRAYAIIVDGGDNIIVTGGSRGTGTSSDYSTVKYNSAGSQQWAARYNGSANDSDRAYAIIVDGGDNIIVTGESVGSGTNFDYATVKYNTGGTQQWVARYNGPGNSQDRAYAIIVDGSDNVYVTGSSRSSNTAGSEDYSTLKYSSGGSQVWNVRYDGTGTNEDRAYAIIVDGSDNVFITGGSRNSSLLGSEDYLTIKYAPEKSVVSMISNEIPVKNGLSQNYPNPFNPKTQIQFDVAKQSGVKISVYNVLGNEVAVLVNQNLTAGTYSVTWDASLYSSGIYFYRISVDNFIDTKKLILAK